MELITKVEVLYFNILGNFNKFSPLSENENERDLKNKNLKSFDNSNGYRLNTDNINSKNGLIRENEELDLPHKYQINLPHIQKIYDEENNNYIRSFYHNRSLKSNENNVSIENSKYLKNNSDSSNENNKINETKYEIVERNQIVNVDSYDFIEKERNSYNK